MAIQSMEMDALHFVLSKMVLLAKLAVIVPYVPIAMVLPIKHRIKLLVSHVQLMTVQLVKPMAAARLVMFQTTDSLIIFPVIVFPYPGIMTMG